LVARVYRPKNRIHGSPATGMQMSRDHPAVIPIDKKQIALFRSEMTVKFSVE
jgi:hypothetical protein